MATVAMKTNHAGRESMAQHNSEVLPASAGPEVENAIDALLARLATRAVQPIVWKNVHRIELALAGDADLDLLFRLEDRETVLDELGAAGWLEGQNPRIPRDDRIRHFFRTLGPGRPMAHLHLYFGVVTGESWLKEYDLPVVDLLFTDADAHPTGQRVISPSSGRYLFWVRHLLKGGSLISRALYRRELDDYKEEFDRVREASTPAEDPLGLRDVIEQLDDTAAIDAPAPFGLASAARRDLSRFRRFSRVSLPLRRLRGLVLRVVMLRRPTRRLADRGAVIAIVGSDGSGKTSIIDGLDERFSSTFAVERVHLGRPVPVSLSLLKRLSGGRDPRDSAPVTDHAADRVDTRPSAGFGGVARALVLTGARTLAARRARRLADRGTIVLADRWPNERRQGIDGRRLDPTDETPWRAAAARVEDRMFAAIPPADLALYLQVPLDVAIERNDARTKGVKETEDEIRGRHSRSMALEPRASTVHVYRNDGELDAAVDELFEFAWNHIAMGGDR